MEYAASNEFMRVELHGFMLIIGSILDDRRRRFLFLFFFLAASKGWLGHRGNYTARRLFTVVRNGGSQ
jgi:hypothetical protein